MLRQVSRASPARIARSMRTGRARQRSRHTRRAPHAPTLPARCCRCPSRRGQARATGGPPVTRPDATSPAIAEREWRRGPEAMRPARGRSSTGRDGAALAQPSRISAFAAAIARWNRAARYARCRRSRRRRRRAGERVRYRSLRPACPSRPRRTRGTMQPGSVSGTPVSLLSEPGRSARLRERARVPSWWSCRRAWARRLASHRRRWAAYRPGDRVATIAFGVGCRPDPARRGGGPRENA